MMLKFLFEYICFLKFSFIHNRAFEDHGRTTGARSCLVAYT